MTAFFTQIAKITDHLYLCGAHALSSDKLKRLGITHVFNCTIELPSMQNIETTKVNVDDTPHARLSVHFDRCADKIKQVKDRGGKSLVHCMAGVSRSSSICIAYLMKYENMKLREAYHYVKSKRPVIRPNVGFFRQLIDYEKKVYGASTVGMISSPIGAIPDVYKEEAKNMVWLQAPTRAPWY